MWMSVNDEKLCHCGKKTVSPLGGLLPTSSGNLGLATALPLLSNDRFSFSSLYQQKTCSWWKACRCLRTKPWVPSISSKLRNSAMPRPRASCGQVSVGAWQLCRRTGPSVPRPPAQQAALRTSAGCLEVSFRLTESAKRNCFQGIWQHCLLRQVFFV